MTYFVWIIIQYVHGCLHQNVNRKQLAHIGLAPPLTGALGELTA